MTLQTSRSRGDKNIPAWEKKIMIFELTEAMRYVRKGMREQSNKDKILNHLNTEINELKQIAP